MRPTVTARTFHTYLFFLLELCLFFAQELEKLISFSGTPTVVWRRTGEICLAGMEFCMLTEWSRHDLLGQKRYIYEVSPPESSRGID